jgi:glyoxylase-like metal-dependent hydrolase (beta-lactamase superfamily II)
MNITEPGRIAERIVLLGRHESCVSLIDGGSELALLGGAMSYVVPEVLEQLERFGIDVKKITRLVVLHSHFDHCGMIPFLKKRWPWAVVTASAKAKDLLSTPKVSQTIAAMNAAAAARYGRSDEVRRLGAEFTGIEVEQTVDDGDVLTCGDLELRVVGVPGHSSCSIALFEPTLKALFPSDAAGIACGDFFLSAGSSSFDQYQQSLERLSTLDVDVLCKEHYGAHVGDDARGYLARSIVEAARTRDLLVRAWRASRDITKATEAALVEISAGYPADFLPREILTIVVGQMVGYIARSIGDA